MADLRIDVAAEFKGKKAFKEADKAVFGLDKNVVKLAKSLGLAFGTKAIVQYGKAAVKAFAADQASAQRLATAVDNLGLSMSQSRVTDFIANLEKSSAIADDVLRPAFQALLTTTGSLTQSQKLLNNAIQISRASGIDLATVSQDLANGYVGITKGLKKYNTGLTQAELKSKSFNDILGIMLARSAGAAQAYLTTTAYKMDALTLAGENAKETIGAGLVNALAKLGGGTSTADAVKAIDNIAKGINGITNAAATAIGLVVKLYRGLDYLTSFGGRTGAGGTIDQYVIAKEKQLAQFKNPRSASPAGTYNRTKQQREAEAAAAKRAKELAALTKKQIASQKALTEEQKKQAILKKAGTLFDLEQIQIIAALKNNISDEERKRLELQFAILTGNTTEAQRLTYELAKSQGMSEELAKYLASLDFKNNPFASWSAYLDDLMEKARKLALMGFANQPTAGNGSLARGADFAAQNPVVQSLITNATGTNRAGVTAAGDVYVSVQGSVVSSEDLVAAIENGLQVRSLSGSNSVVGRIAGMFG